MSKDAAVLNSYPVVDEEVVNGLLQNEIIKNKKKIIVLDDDPTGVQTVHDVSVYTDWSIDNIRAGFAEENKLFYILTNSRGFTAEETTKAHREIAENLHQVSVETKQEFLVISRSDSTLRGHYPLETQILKKEYEEMGDGMIDGEILCPFFKEGGRYTIDDIHYVKYGNELIPAGETEFARDKTFGYISSNLKEYIEEKTKGEYKKEDVVSISLKQLRNLEITAIKEQLMQIKNFNKVIVNAIDYIDLKVFCIALYQALDEGKNFLFRTAAAIVKVLGGVSDQPLLIREKMIINQTNNGGIIVIGSHTEKTTNQLNELRRIESLKFIEFNSDLVLDGEEFQREIERIVEEEESCIKKGQTVVVYTRRKLLSVAGDTKEAALRRSVKISDAVQSLVGKLKVTPRFVVAKGGITSSDIGTKALAVKRAKVMGQIKPGIPVWQTGNESKFPNTPYVIFPGNVGETETLREAVEELIK